MIRLLRSPALSITAPPSASRRRTQGATTLELTVALTAIALAGLISFPTFGASARGAIAGDVHGAGRAVSSRTVPSRTVPSQTEGGGFGAVAPVVAPAAQAGILSSAKAALAAADSSGGAAGVRAAAEAADDFVVPSLDDLHYTVGLDVDQVLAQHDRAFRDIVAHEHGRLASELSLEHYGWDFAEWGIAGANRGEFFRLRSKAVAHYDYLARLEPMPGGPTATRLLREAGARLHIITHRLFGDELDPLVMRQTHRWLRDSRIPFDDISFEGQKARVPAHRYVDDAPHNVESFEAVDRNAVLFEASYNREYQPKGPGTARARNWVEAADVITGDMVEHGLLLPRARAQLIREVAVRVRAGRP
jgi:5'-nucleotidase